MICEWAAIGSADGLAYHLVPIDVIDHSIDETCVCGADVIPIAGGKRTIVNHHQLVRSLA